MHMKISRDDLRRLIREEMSRLLETQTASTNPMMSAETHFGESTPKPYITGVVTSSPTANLANPLSAVKSASSAAEIFSKKHGITTDDYHISCVEEPPKSGRWSCEARKDIGAASAWAGEEGPAGAESI